MLNEFKRQIAELLKSLETGDRTPLATINPQKYIQHNLRVADGLEGFRVARLGRAGFDGQVRPSSQGAR
jgi:hypothetical protein